MDTSFWKSLSPEIKIESSVKQFYKQYYYKLDIYAPGCKSIRCNDVASNLYSRREHIRVYNYSGSWFDKKLAKYLKEADLGFLLGLKDIYYEYPDVKIRCEEPRMSIYATDELMIQSVAKSIDPDHRNKIISITGPENEELKAVLTANTILVKKPPKYRYRVWFKEKQFEEETRQQVYNYLTGLGDLVRMSEHTRESLNKPHNWIWGCYFYTNDKGVATFVTLLHPDLVREVSELVCVDNK
jgi:hypothetical protein